MPLSARTGGTINAYRAETLGIGIGIATPRAAWRGNRARHRNGGGIDGRKRGSRQARRRGINAHSGGGMKRELLKI
jgi:hypothetical protein